MLAEEASRVSDKVVPTPALARRAWLATTALLAAVAERPELVAHQLRVKRRSPSSERTSPSRWILRS
jgi:hypothetical protein